MPGREGLDGDLPANICNRTFRPFDGSPAQGGAQLEMTRELRDSLFSRNGSAETRSANTNGAFTAFVNACRAAVAEQERIVRTGEATVIPG
ncbi:poly-gamma-glutamate hydrolase family protein [Streptomyces sp. NPDC085524]|uniref:poly-gamma-glutamate hydrolase family protein n=1 Tax=Streptomyces sp. NPDC085524 TaxID=3365728 RepID=UPI0037D86F8E